MNASAGRDVGGEQYEKSVLMIEAQQIGCFALSKAVHDVLRLPQRGAAPV